MTVPTGLGHRADDFKLQQKCLAKCFSLGLGERLEEVAAILFRLKLAP